MTRRLHNLEVLQGACAAARLVSFDHASQPEDPLAREGWTRRNLCDSRRVIEARSLYEALGLEVRLEAPRPDDFGPECAECLAHCHDQVFLYTRPRGAR
ncbi:MAG: hypothetical protein KF901_22080 [Myxococcales bacterium]|nr:hypothetical protein [Myxococcales bacterium]